MMVHACANSTLSAKILLIYAQSGLEGPGVVQSLSGMEENLAVCPCRFVL